MSMETFVNLSAGTAFGFQLATAVANASTAGSRAPAPIAAVRRAPHIRRARYGSPIEFIVDLEPALRLVSDNGYIILGGILLAFFKKGAETWKLLEEAATTRAERRQQKRTNEPSARVEPDGSLTFGPNPMPSDEELAELGPLTEEAHAIEPLASLAASSGGDYDAARIAGFRVVRSLSHADAMREMARRPDREIYFK